MSDYADTRQLSGAQFRREVGADPEKWAAEFLKAASGPMPRTEEERIAFTAQWFRDAMDAAVREAVHAKQI